MATGDNKGGKKGGKHIKEFLTVLFPSCEVFAAGHDWRNKATRTSTTFRVCSQINDHTHVRNADKDGGGLMPHVRNDNTAYQLHKSLIQRVKAWIDTIHFIPATVRRSQQKRVWIQVPVRHHMDW